MPLIEVRGVELHTQELGDRSSAKPSVAMLHGLLLGSIASWYFTAAPALAKTRRVLLFDLRGHGRSARVKTGYDVATMAGDLDELASRFDDRPIDLVGHSYGALVALRFAMERPRRVRRLALVEPPLPPSRFGEIEAFVAQTPEKMIASLPEPTRAFMAGGGRRATRLVDALRFLMTETTLADDLAREADVPDEALAKIDRPVLVVAGDRSMCLHASRRIASAVPGAKLAVLSGGHFLHVDAPVELAKTLEEFLDG